MTGYFYVRVAARNSFTVISGGPDTGKTTTVVKVLALFQSLAQTDAPLKEWQKSVKSLCDAPHSLAARNDQ